MAEESARGAVRNPLWIISLFLGLAEVAGATVATQTHGWIQGLFAVFAVVYPVAVTAAFFVILWQKSIVFFSPDQYSQYASVTDYAAAMRSFAKDSKATLREAVRAGVQVSVTRVGKGSLGANEKASVVEEAVKAAEEDLLQRGVSVDLSGISPGVSEAAFFPVEGSTTVSNFLNQVYFSIQGNVRAFSYGRSWILQDLGSGHDLRDIGSLWARKEMGQTSDTRPLSDVGISPGARLIAKRLSD
jgi:hypothetical protein